MFVGEQVHHLTHLPHLQVVTHLVDATALHFISVHVFVHLHLLLSVDHLIRRNCICVTLSCKKVFQNVIQFFWISLCFESHILWICGLIHTCIESFVNPVSPFQVSGFVEFYTPFVGRHVEHFYVLEVCVIFFSESDVVRF